MNLYNNIYQMAFAASGGRFSVARDAVASYKHLFVDLTGSHLLEHIFRSGMIPIETRVKGEAKFVTYMAYVELYVVVGQSSGHYYSFHYNEEEAKKEIEK